MTLKLNQKRVWLDQYGGGPLTDYPVKVIFIGKRIAVVREVDGFENSYDIELLEKESIEVVKLKKNLKEALMMGSVK